MPTPLAKMQVVSSIIFYNGYWYHSLVLLVNIVFWIRALALSDVIPDVSYLWKFTFVAYNLSWGWFVRLTVSYDTGMHSTDGLVPPGWFHNLELHVYVKNRCECYMLLLKPDHVITHTLTRARTLAGKQSRTQARVHTHTYTKSKETLIVRF